MLSRFGFLSCNCFKRILVGEFTKGHDFHSTASKSQGGECCSEKKEKPLMDIDCKVAIITGGTSGIGYACAEQLLCNGLHKAIISGINKPEGEEAVKKLNTEFGKDKADFFDVDVNCQEQFEDMFKEVLKRYKRIDILINNAGMLNDQKWELTGQTNFTGVVRGTFLAFQYMAANGDCNKGEGGIVINMASILGLDACPPIPVYSSTKHGVIGIVKNFGDNYHFCDTKLRVTAMCPGVTHTVLVNEAVGKQYKDKWGEDAEKALGSWPKQPPSACGKACVHMVKHAPTATVWIIEGSKLYLADIPDRKKISKLVASFD